MATKNNTVRLLGAYWHRLWLALAVVGLVLFPFDWLGNVWPGYAVLFDRVFVSSRDHAIGHATLFFLAGLALLIVIPWLQARPLLYLALMVVGALLQESIQSLFKLTLPNLGDGRDLLFDALGYGLAMGVVWLVRVSWQRRAGRADGHI